MLSKEEILRQFYDVEEGFTGHEIGCIHKAMDEYAKQSMVNLIENIFKQEVQVYSSKERGQEKKYFLGKTYVDDLIKRIKNS